MKILHVSLGLPPYRTGGLTKYSIDLMVSQKELNHEVSLIYPGHFNILKGLSIENNLDYKGIKVYEIINPLPVPLLGGIKQPKYFVKGTTKQKFLDFLSKLSPEVIHFHTLMGIHKEFLEAAKEKNIKIIYTTHDYFGICPKVNLMDKNGEVCENYINGVKCIQCNINGYSLPMIYLMQTRVYRSFKNSPVITKLRSNKKKQYMKRESNNEIQERNVADINLANEYIQLREYYLQMLNLVDFFHFNSSVARDEYKKYLDAKGQIISITHSDIKDNRKKRDFSRDNQTLRLTYLGPVDRYKGFYFLKESLDELSNDMPYKWHLNIYGNSENINIEYDPKLYTLNGKYNYKDLETIFDKTDLLVVPSIWKETFGFIGLEALSFGIPTMVSEFVGFKDLIESGETGFIIKPTVNDLKRNIVLVLEKRGILNKINENLNDMKFNYLMENHVKEIFDIYNG